MDDDVIKIPDDDEKSREDLRRLDQLYTCPCTNCEARCWDTGHMRSCRPYRLWWRTQNGVRT